MNSVLRKTIHEQKKVSMVVDAASETAIVRGADRLEIIFAAVGLSLSFQNAAHLRAYLRRLDTMLGELRQHDENGPRGLS